MNETGSLRDALVPLTEKDGCVKFLSAIAIEKYGLIHLLSENQSEIFASQKSNVVLTDLTIEAVSITIDNSILSLKKMLDVIADSQVNLSFCFAYSNDQNQATVILGAQRKVIQQLQDILTRYEE